MRELTIAAGAVRALLGFAVSRGANREILTKRSEIHPADLEDRDQRIPFAKYVVLMRAGQELCRGPALALHFGESVPVSEISLAHMLGASSETMTEGLALMNRYAPLTVEVDQVDAGDRFVFERGNGQVRIIDTRAHANESRELTESAFARMVCTGRRFGGESSDLKAVHVTHAEPSYRAEYDRIFRAPVTFRSHRNALLSDDSWMARKPPSTSRPTLDVLKAHSEALLEKLESAKSTSGRVESLLMTSLGNGGGTMTAIARPLGPRRHSLFRRLRAEGAALASALDRPRHHLP